MSEKYSTDELVEALEAYGIANAIIKQEEILAIIARLRAADNLKNKSLMKLAADLGVSFSAAKIISDHAREEYDAKITKADVLCEAAKKLGWMIPVYPHIGGHVSLLSKISKAIADYEKGDMT